MGTNTYDRTKNILKIMHVLAYIVFVGICIEAGATIISYIVSLFNMATAGKMYTERDLLELAAYSVVHYSLVVSLIVAVLIIQALVALQVIKVLSRVNMENPFTIQVQRRLEWISYLLLGMSLVALAGNAYMGWLSHYAGIALEEMEMSEYFVVAGLVYVISQVFRRGVELQYENELTV